MNKDFETLLNESEGQLRDREMALLEQNTENDMQLIVEASKGQSFFTTWALGTFVVGPVLTMALIASGGGILAALGMAVGGIGGFVGGLLSTLFVKGKQRTLYDKMQKKTKALLDYMRRQDRELAKMEDGAEKERFIRSVQDQIERKSKEIEEIQKGLDVLIARDTGREGLFRSRLSKVVHKRIMRGKDVDVKAAVRDVKTQVMKYQDAANDNDAGEDNVVSFGRAMNESMSDKQKEYYSASAEESDREYIKHNQLKRMISSGDAVVIVKRAPRTFDHFWNEETQKWTPRPHDATIYKSMRATGKVPFGGTVVSARSISDIAGHYR